MLHNCVTTFAIIDVSDVVLQYTRLSPLAFIFIGVRGESGNEASVEVCNSFKVTAIVGISHEAWANYQPIRFPTTSPEMATHAYNHINAPTTPPPPNE